MPLRCFKADQNVLTLPYWNASDTAYVYNVLRVLPDTSAGQLPFAAILEAFRERLPALALRMASYISAVYVALAKPTAYPVQQFDVGLFSDDELIPGTISGGLMQMVNYCSPRVSRKYVRYFRAEVASRLEAHGLREIWIDDCQYDPRLPWATFDNILNHVGELSHAARLEGVKCVGNIGYVLHPEISDYQARQMAQLLVGSAVEQSNWAVSTTDDVNRIINRLRLLNEYHGKIALCGWDNANWQQLLQFEAGLAMLGGANIYPDLPPFQPQQPWMQWQGTVGDYTVSGLVVTAKVGKQKLTVDFGNQTAVLQ